MKKGRFYSFSPHYIRARHKIEESRSKKREQKGAKMKRFNPILPVCGKFLMFKYSCTHNVKCLKNKGF